MTGGRAGWERGRPARNAALARGDTLILAFSHKGRRDPLVGIWAWFRAAGLAAGVWIPAFAGMTGGRAGWERGRPARNAALARGDTLILAFSHKGRRDPLVGIWAWFRAAGLAAGVWIPAFAGMMGGERAGMTGAAGGHVRDSGRAWREQRAGVSGAAGGRGESSSRVVAWAAGGNGARVFTVPALAAALTLGAPRVYNRGARFHLFQKGVCE